VQTGIGFDKYDSEGRFVITDHGSFKLYNIYFPNGGSGDERHNYKQEFLKDLFQHLKEKVAAGERLIITGDYNIAHTEIDVYDPVGLAKESGFLPEERAWLSEFLELGFIDTFRFFHPGEKDRFTWWSYRERGRVNNRGWRIDYFCVTANLQAALKRSEILDTVEGSDHCPLLLELDLTKV
ncbi:MAG: exodeoxyribonuclease III, partial [Candidatus Paceibacterales bacterium]